VPTKCRHAVLRFLSLRGLHALQQVAMPVRLGDDVQPLPVLLSKMWAQVLTVLFLPRAVLLTVLVPGRRHFPSSRQPIAGGSARRRRERARCRDHVLALTLGNIFYLLTKIYRFSQFLYMS